MSRSPYTIDVGPCKADGTRDVLLHCHQRPCFSTTHRGITRVCLAKWPARAHAKEASATNDMDESEALRTQRAELVYQTLLETGSPTGTTPQSLAAAAAATTLRGSHGEDTDDGAALEQYLVVFHREELADQYGRFTFVQPHTISTAYRLSDSTVMELVLHNVTPSDIAAAATGVFVRGSRQSHKGPAPSTSIEHHGLLYKPALDLWWMGAPLSLKPVYVAAPLPAAVGGAAPPSIAAAASGWDQVNLRAGNSAGRPADSAAAEVNGAGTGSPHSGDVKGRTAQGQFEFYHSRSSSPVMGSPSPTSAAVPLDASSPVTGFPSTPLPASPAGVRGRYVSVEATVLTQLELFQGKSGEPCAASLAVVRTQSDELGLATTTPQYALDCMLWQWWPHRVRVPHLSGSNNAAVSVAASVHASLDRYVLFLYDARHGTVTVLRTPDLRTGAGGFEVLFLVPTGGLPFVLPCLRAPHPAPVAVCNYPRPNCIAVYDVVSLLNAPSADTIAMTLDLEEYQAAHPQLFGEVRTASQGGTATTAAAAINDHVEAAQEPGERAATRAATAASWRADGVRGVPHPICSVLYHYEQRLVVEYAWPSGTAEAVDEREDDDAATILRAAGGIGGAPRGGAGVPARHRCRQRCEGTVSYAVELPAVLPETEPLLLFMLEALSASLSPRAVVALEYRLLTALWRRACRRGAACDAFDLSADLVRAACGVATPLRQGGMPENGAAVVSVREAAAVSSAVAAADTSIFVDPAMLTLEQVRRCVAPRPDRCTVQGGAPIASEKARGSLDQGRAFSGAAPPCAWTVQERGLALVALHLLFESLRAQEHLWPLLPRLAALARDVSHAMQWPSYMEFYDATAPILPVATTTASPAPQDFASVLPPDVLRRRFDSLTPATPAATGVFSGATRSSSGAAAAGTTMAPEAAKSAVAEFACGDVPSFFVTLSRLATCGATTTGSALAAACASVPANTGGAVYGSWPLLRRLPQSHPIAVANRVAQLYQGIFSLPSSMRLDSAAADVTAATWWEGICGLLLQRRLSAALVRQTLNTAVAYPLVEALAKGRARAQSTWPAALLDLVGRRDRCLPSSPAARVQSTAQHVVETAEENAVARQFRAALSDDDGVSVRPDFRVTWRDTRLDTVQNLFNTVAPISLAGYEDRPEELTGALELLSARARALPLGRGMLTMCTQSFKVQDSIPIPPLNLSGRTNDGIHVASKATEELMWPLFHNGCAAGLRFLPLPPAFASSASGDVGAGAGGATAGVASAGELGGAAGGEAASLSSAAALAAPGSAAQSITKQWVMYQTKNIGNPASRAGLLLATGILGHLTVLQRTDIFYLLISRQEQYVWREATTMAVMLGLSCSFCGTGNEAVFRCLSVHVQSLNPSAEDIEVSLDVQTAALAAMGLLCQRSPSNTFLVEVLLVELSRMPTDEHCAKREGYVLGAGFGLGQLLLGVGEAHGVQHVEERLLAVMTGAPRSFAVATREGVEYFEETMGRGEAGHFLARALVSQDEREATYHTCASVYEGDCYNVFVSGPAAATALGMMYLQTDHAFIASRMAPPNRRAAMQKLNPLMCHLRSTMASLVRWSAIEPTRHWLYEQVPSSLLELTQTPVPGLATQQVNYLLMNLAHCLAGHVMALGLRYAGTMDAAARDVIFVELQGFLSGQIGSTKAPIPAVQRATGAYESCLLACANALSLVMAGTGDLRVLSVLNQLHRRTNVAYGSHMATSMSLGLLFLGSGRLTLSNSLSAVAALLMAFFPVWPKDPEDNTCHLQALRHLYGMAVVPRVMEAVDAVSHQPVSLPVRIVLRARPHAHGRTDEGHAGAAAVPAAGHREGALVQTMVTPCLYPPVEMIERVEVRGTQYYPLVFYSFSQELTQSTNMVIRVMAKEGGSGGAAGPDSFGILGRSGGGRGLPSARTPLESRLLGWLHRLFRQRTTTTTASLTILDSIKLALTVQRSLLSRAAAEELLLSGDFAEAMAAAMERRYSFLFLHGAPTASMPMSASGAEARQPSQPPHPLRQLVLEGRSVEEVVHGIAQHPHGTAVFPCDVTALVELSDNTNGSRPAVSMEGTLHAASPASACVDVAALGRWVTEALFFYGLHQRELRLVRGAFVALKTADKTGVAAGAWMSAMPEQPTGHTSNTAAVRRLSALLRLQATTQLPLATLERLWSCCLP